MALPRFLGRACAHLLEQQQSPVPAAARRQAAEGAVETFQLRLVSFKRALGLLLGWYEAGLELISSSIFEGLWIGPIVGPKVGLAIWSICNP